MKNKPVVFHSLAQLHRAMGQKPPSHPSVSVINYGDAHFDPLDFENGIVLDFYKISLKTSFSGKLKYGQGCYEFEEGGMSFVAPGQILRMQEEEADYDGMSLHIHPDFLRPYAIGNHITRYGFFSYSASEALYLSEKEKSTIASIYRFIQDELGEHADRFSPEVIIAQIEVLLTYGERFYDRQFLTRKAVNHSLLARLEECIRMYFEEEKALKRGLPSVQDMALQLEVTPRYLSDMMKKLLGLTAQQWIHERVIEKSKEYLAKREMGIGEIAYQLGFEHPQSFNKLFKGKTLLSPSDYRKMLLG